MFWHVLTGLGSTVGMTIIHPFLFIWSPLHAHTLGDGLSEKQTGHIRDLETPRHGLFCPTQHDDAFWKLGGNFARNRVLLHSPPMLLLNFVCWFGSLLALWAPFVYTLSFGESVGKALLMGLVPFMTSSFCFMIHTQERT